MNAYDRLKHAATDERFSQMVNGAFFAIHKLGTAPLQALSHMADNICGLYGLSAEVHRNAVVFYHLTSRAKHPAAIMVSMGGGSPSPSATLLRNTEFALIQVFEGDADDTDEVADTGAVPTHWVETKGRVLLH